MKKILIAAGGTGGHIYPAICLAEKLEKMCQPVFVIRKDDKWESVLTEKKYNYYGINISGFPRKILIELLYFFPKLFFSFFKAFSIIKKVKPDKVIGLGGYVSFPIVCIAKLCRISTIIHEQNVIPGLANKLLAHITDKIAISFYETEKFFPKDKTYFTGNFIREELFEVSRNQAFEYFKLDRAKFTVLVFGGSQGARSINKFIVDSLELIEEYKNSIQFIHLTGERDFVFVKDAYLGKDFQAIVLPYLHEMWNAYAVADLVISRAGATTIAELIALRKPAVLIPYPYATGNHQLYNAKYLEKMGLAVVIEEKNLNREKFKEVLTEFLKQPEKLVNLVNKIRLPKLLFDTKPVEIVDLL
ncbi:MAG: undecaprenyldiphospho-muramoylpentapeptide beta-N-acetylglucosaminyltransferase [Elusimicrobiota bacterium]|nr:undecaprenyldiphospho-muramoylpentapeptide beta-N-acetylglucosaminyltransferase [Elusimicrobiota bacterium]